MLIYRTPQGERPWGLPVSVVETTRAPCNQPVYCVVTKQRRYCRRQVSGSQSSAVSGFWKFRQSAIPSATGRHATPRLCFVSFGQILRHQIRRKIKRQPNNLRSFYFSTACTHAVREKNSHYAAEQLIKSRRQNIVTTCIGELQINILRA